MKKNAGRRTYEDPYAPQAEHDGAVDIREISAPLNLRELPEYLQNIEEHPDPESERRVDRRTGLRGRTGLDPQRRRKLWSRRGVRYGLAAGLLILIAVLIVFFTLVLPRIRERSVKPTPESMPIPSRYADLIAFYAEANSVDPFLVTAVMRTESDFRPDVVSHADAIGLMQILPDTGAWLGERIGLEVSREDLFDPVINIRLGTSFLRYLFGIFDNEISTAVAAYNAGQGHVGEWLKDEQYSKDGRTLDMIPFAETRHYVERVLTRRDRYVEAYKGVFPGDATKAFADEEEAAANINP